jgi:amino acid adenylation domain-containing protein
MGILVDELIHLYEAFARNSTPALPPLRIHYKDYACWQAGLLQQGISEAHKTYWINQFKGELPVLRLPEDRPRPEVQTYRGAIIRRDIGTSLYNSLKQLSAAEGGTVFTGLLSVLSILLYRYTNQHEMIIGSPVAGREHMELQNQIGLYINTIALRIHFNGEDHFRQVFKNTRQVVVDAYEHQSYPFDELVSLVNAERDVSRNTLFDVMIVLENEDAVRPEERTMGAMKIRRHAGLEITTSKLDLLFLFKEHNRSLSLTIEYNSDIFNRHTVEQLAENFEGLMAAVISAPLVPVCRLDYLNENTKKQLIYTFNNTTDAYDQNEMILSLIKKYTISNANTVAVSAGDIELTYGELDARSDHLAAWLQQQGGVVAGERVGVQLPRNEWLIIALLAVWKTGAAYVPIDPLYPPERIAFIIADSQCKTIIDEALRDQMKQVMLPGNSLQYCKHDQNDLAYIIYTSGSTGTPKGVMIAHRSVTAFINWCHKEFVRSRFEVVFAATSICFDLSVFEIFFTLSCGKRLRLLPDALAIPAYLEQEKEVLLNTVPSVVGALLREQVNWPAVTVLNIAGEPIPAKYIAALDCESIEVRNLYGPTEDTTYSTCYRIKNGEPVLIGRPISNTQVYILDENWQLMPTGTSGEICLGGHGLANGYLNQSALTAMKFIDNPFFPGQRIYRTGDIGRWLPDGNISLAGRKDNQVKIRGHRIEPGEIEDVLQGLRGIDKAVVLVEEDNTGDKNLVAFIQGRGEPDLSTLRTGLRNKLPSYMMPGMFIQVDQFPLTPNGKIDTAQLKLTKGRTLLNITEYIAPRNDVEQRLAEIWQEVLGKERIGVKDNFFEAGGHSLKAARLISRIKQNFDVHINLLNIFREPTIENIAEQISFTLHQGSVLKNKKDLIRIEV